jgi:L-ribulose-5-phosphate 4-epimerase
MMRVDGALREQVYAANMQLPAHGLVKFTWGNVSGIDRRSGIVIIKPSGVRYEDMQAGDMVAVDLQSGKQVSGGMRPSSDTATHLELYRKFPEIGGIVHTHSMWATVFSQMCRPIPPLGTTHADYFYGEIPCTRPMTDTEILGDYERETGRVIAEAYREGVPAVLVANHGPFAWGRDAEDAVHNAAVLEEVACMAWHTLQQEKSAAAIGQALLDKHYLRKHGAGAYYGQG